MTTAPSRRDIAKGAAWTLPTITLVASAPAIAASVCMDTTRTVSMTATLDPGNPNVTWTNNGPDAAPAGTKLTYTISSVDAKDTTGYMTISADNDEGFTQSITSGALKQITAAGTSLTTIVEVTLTSDLASGDSITTTWTTKYSKVAPATAQAKGVMHPDGFGGGSTHIASQGSGPDQSGTQAIADGEGCTITLNLTLPAFSSAG